MKKIMFVLTMIIIITSTALASAGDWEFNIMGINPAHFKGRRLSVVIFGGLVSLLVHEGSHLAYAHNHGGGSFDWDERTIMIKPDGQSDSEMQTFYRAGFLGQLIVGSVLTAIPYTRHKDFTLGFNTTTSLGTAVYTMTGGLGEAGDEDRSDIHQLDNGRTEGTIYAASAGILAYINLKKPMDIEMEVIPCLHPGAEEDGKVKGSKEKLRQ